MAWTLELKVLVLHVNELLNLVRVKITVSLVKGLEDTSGINSSSEVFRTKGFAKIHDLSRTFIRGPQIIRKFSL